LFIVVRLVDRFGDIRGIWIPSNVLALGYALGVVLIPAGYWQLCYVLFPLLGGPSGALAGFAPELLAKLVPPDLHGTFHTAKSFAYDGQKAIMVWPWLWLLTVSEDLPYPFDALPIWVAMALGLVTLWATCRLLKDDPRSDIWSGHALDPYWESEYARERCLAGPCRRVLQADKEAKQDQATSVVGQGASQAGLFVRPEDMDDGLQNYLKFVIPTMPAKPSLSLVIKQIEGEDLFASRSLCTTPRSRPGSATPRCLEDGVMQINRGVFGDDLSVSEVSNCSVMPNADVSTRDHTTNSTTGQPSDEARSHSSISGPGGALATDVNGGEVGNVDRSGYPGGSGVQARCFPNSIFSSCAGFGVELPSAPPSHRPPPPLRVHT
jgi:hypothetical protein